MRPFYTGCNGPCFDSRGCALGLATLQRDGFAPVAVLGGSLALSLDGGSTSGVRVGVVGDPKRTAAARVPITGKRADVVVSWEGLGSDLSMLYGAVQLEIVIPEYATVFAFVFWEPPVPVASGAKVAMAASTGAKPANTEYGGGDYTKAWDGDTVTFYDYLEADGGYTEATVGGGVGAAGRSVSCLRFFPRAHFTAGRYEGGQFVGYTSAGKAVPLATITALSSFGQNFLPKQKRICIKDLLNRLRAHCVYIAREQLEQNHKLCEFLRLAFWGRAVCGCRMNT